MTASPSRSPSPARRRVAGLALLAGLGLSLGCLAQAPAELQLPLRNVLIEVRQDDGSSQTRERVAADLQARVSPDRSEADITLDARSQQTERSGLARQQVLVLNGRPGVIRLGVNMPLRLRQLVTQGGVRRLVPGTVWLQAGTGFTATPVWEGGDTVYLALAATQGRDPLGQTASTSTTLMLPLDEWVTVAENEDQLDQQNNATGLGGLGREQRSGSARLRVQVRVSVPGPGR